MVFDVCIRRNHFEVSSLPSPVNEGSSVSNVEGRLNNYLNSLVFRECYELGHFRKEIVRVTHATVDWGGSIEEAYTSPETWF